MSAFAIFVPVLVAVAPVGLAFGFRAAVLLTRSIGGGGVAVTVTVLGRHDSSFGGCK
jgi:hypothetical protein